MKKVFVPLFSAFLVAVSSVLFTGQKISTSIKIEKIKEIKNHQFKDSLYELKDQDNFNFIQIQTFKAQAQSWDSQSIDKILTQALWFTGEQLTFNYQKLNISKLPSSLVENIKIILVNLNNAVAFGLIKPELNGQNIKLVYSDNNVSNDDSEIIYFKSNPILSTFSSYIWYTTYGPSRWWKFWEWGGYLHFSENAVKVARIINPIASLLNIVFLFKNINEIYKNINKLTSAWTKGSKIEIDIELKSLAKILGQLVIDKLGDVINIVTIFTSIITFLIALVESGPGTIILAILELFSSILASVTGRMIDTDHGNGVKWQWPNFIIPGNITAK